MRIDLTQFRGAMPIITSRSLPVQNAAESVNAEFEGASLAPIKLPLLVHTFPADVLTIYRHSATWLGWNAIVDVARAPVAADRLYYTGDGAPKVRNAGVVYGLAVPAPATKPTTVNIGVVDPDFEETILFVYTYVTSLGEESAPSPPSDALAWSPGLVTTVDAFEAVPAGRAITHRRIYRSQTTAAGVTGFFFAAEIAIAVTTFDVDVAAAPLQEPLETQDFDTPPAGLAGIVAMPNGMMAAFSGNDLYFSEPYKPHAWPEKYVLTVDWPIVGLAVFGSSLAILTTGSPYIAQGITPDSMAMEKMETGVPCVSRRGIVDLGYAAVYPSPEGLALISPSEAKLVSTGVYSLDQWQDLTPASIVAQRFKGRYLFCYSKNANLDLFGGGPDGWDTPPAVDDLYGGEPDGWAANPIDLFGGEPDAFFGERKFASFDLGVQMPDVTDITFALPLSMWRDETSHVTYFLASDMRSVYAWADSRQPNSTATWRSKVFSGIMPHSYGVAFIRTERPLITGDIFLMRVFANGAQIGEVTRANSIERLPAQRMGEEWEIEIVSSVPVISAQIAGSPDELVMS